MAKKVVLIALFIIAFSERVAFDLGPNIELVTAVMLLTAYYFGAKASLILTLLVIATSDLILGTTSIFIFTWTGFAIPALASGSIFKKLANKNLLVKATGLGIGTTLFFYFWTNFGVWLTDSWGMYSNDFSGLISSYINAIPFLRLHLLSTLLFVPLGFTLSQQLKPIYSFLRPKALQILQDHYLFFGPKQIKNR